MWKPRTTSRQRRAGRQGPGTGKLQQITELITSTGLDLVGVQEVLANPKNLTQPAYDNLRAALGAEWTGCLSQRPDPRGIRVGRLAREQLSDPTDVAVYPTRCQPPP